jgi:predicted O-methyltransferase YrrM
MSVEDEVVTRGLLEYVAEHTRGEDAHLAALRAAAGEAGLPPISIGPAQGSLLGILLKLVRAREVVEVGTLGGYSATWMARALPAGGRVRTIEASHKHADFAEAWLARSDVSAKVELHRGRGADVLATFADDSADAAFLDADKRNYPLYLEQCLRIVRVGGLIAADNAFGFGQLLDAEPRDADVRHVRAFNDLVAREPRLEGVIVPLGDGCWVAVRVA